MSRKDAKKVPGKAVALGEATGHSHRIIGRSASLWRDDLGQVFVDLKGGAARIVHEEHKTLDLPRVPVVRTIIARQYDAEHGWVRVED